MKNRPDDTFRWRLEIEWNGRHIGWVNAYRIDGHYRWVRKAQEGQPVYRAVGINICEPDAMGQGIGTNALRAFVRYHFDDGVDEIYTQTWSGNARMIRCAQKLGFAECDRKRDARTVNSRKYDGLTFRLLRKPL